MILLPDLIVFHEEVLQMLVLIGITIRKIIIQYCIILNNGKARQCVMFTE